MKRYAIFTVVVLAILVVAWTAFGQEEEGRSAERRQQIERERQRFQNMSEEEKEKYRAQRRERFARDVARRGGIWNREEQQKSIKAIEEQLAKLKATQVPRPEGGFQDLSEEERTKLNEKYRKFTQDQLQTLQAITDQVARLYGRRQLEGEGALYLIVSTNDLKSIQESATKEKAKETSDLLGRMIAIGNGRGLGFGGRRPRGNQSQGGQRQ